MTETEKSPPSLVQEGGLFYMCNTCKESKPSSEFYKGVKYMCKACKRAWQLAYQKTDAGKATMQRSKRKWLYSMTTEQFDALLAAQGGVCAICKQDKPATQSWCVDHDHTCCPPTYDGKQTKTCGKCIRGLLCLRCNNDLGWYEKYAQVILTYLKQ